MTRGWFKVEVRKEHGEARAAASRCTCDIFDGMAQVLNTPMRDFDPHSIKWFVDWPASRHPVGESASGSAARPAGERGVGLRGEGQEGFGEEESGA